jgi:hypothetical protein
MSMLHKNYEKMLMPYYEIHKSLLTGNLLESIGLQKSKPRHIIAEYKSSASDFARSNAMDIMCFEREIKPVIFDVEASWVKENLERDFPDLRESDLKFPSSSRFAEGISVKLPDYSKDKGFLPEPFYITQVLLVKGKVVKTGSYGSDISKYMMESMESIDRTNKEELANISQAVFEMLEKSDKEWYVFFKLTGPMYEGILDGFGYLGVSVDFSGSDSLASFPCKITKGVRMLAPNSFSSSDLATFRGAIKAATLSLVDFLNGEFEDLDEQKISSIEDKLSRLNDKLKRVKSKEKRRKMLNRKRELKDQLAKCKVYSFR